MSQPGKSIQAEIVKENEQLLTKMRDVIFFQTMTEKDYQSGLEFFDFLLTKVEEGDVKDQINKSIERWNNLWTKIKDKEDRAKALILFYINLEKNRLPDEVRSLLANQDNTTIKTLLNLLTSNMATLKLFVLQANKDTVKESSMEDGLRLTAVISLLYQDLHAALPTKVPKDSSVESHLALWGFLGFGRNGIDLQVHPLTLHFFQKLSAKEGKQYQAVLTAAGHDAMFIESTGMLMIHNLDKYHIKKFSDHRKAEAFVQQYKTKYQKPASVVQLPAVFLVMFGPTPENLKEIYKNWFGKEFETKKAQTKVESKDNHSSSYLPLYSGHPPEENLMIHREAISSLRSWENPYHVYRCDFSRMDQLHSKTGGVIPGRYDLADAKAEFSFNAWPIMNVEGSAIVGKFTPTCVASKPGRRVSKTAYPETVSQNEYPLLLEVISLDDLEFKDSHDRDHAQTATTFIMRGDFMCYPFYNLISMGIKVGDSITMPYIKYPNYQQGPLPEVYDEKGKPIAVSWKKKPAEAFSPANAAGASLTQAINSGNNAGEGSNVKAVVAPGGAPAQKPPSPELR